MCDLCSHPFRKFGYTAPNRRVFLGQAGALAGLYVSTKVIGPVDALAQDARADTLIENAKVITLDRNRPTAEAIAVTGETILGVGPRRDLERFRGSSTRVIDAGGRTIIPGLNDAHTHFIRGGLSYAQELRWDGVPSLAIAIQLLRDQAARTPPPHWVQVVGGFTPNQFAEKRLPSLDEINAATGEVPCFIMHLYDRAFINRAGSRMLGFDPNTPDPHGGFIARDGAGNPTGVVLATSSLGSLLGIFARVPKLAPEDQIASTQQFMRELNRLGVTSVIDAGGGGQNYPEHYAAIAKLAADKALTLRVGYTLMAQRPGREIDDYRGWLAQAKLYQGDSYFRLVGAGEYITWAAGDVTNFAKDPVPQPPTMEDKLVEVLSFLASNGWPFRLHASFDFTAQRILGVLEKVHRDTRIDKLRWGFEHGEGITARTLDRIAALGGSMGLQNRMSLDGEAYVAKWGKETAEDAPALGRIRQMGIPFACGTDGNRAASHNPWVGVEWLVTGKTVAGFKHNADRNLLSREDALRAYSESGAWISGEENQKGTLSPGKWADLAVLSDDYMTIPEDRISTIRSLMTMVGGQIVYGDGAFAQLASSPPRPMADWLPINTYPSYREAHLTTRINSNANASGFSRGPLRMVGADGVSWDFGCLCGTA